MKMPRPWGPLSGFGLAAAVAACLVDQGMKLWLIYGFELGRKGAVPVIPFIDFVLIWNKGISYGLFQQEGPVGQWILVLVKAGAVVLLWYWLAAVTSRLSALSLGLIIGGALGNAIDRLVHGAVADFVLFHVQTASFNFNWYIFNLADVAIVAGVLGLLYESFVDGRAAKAPRSP
jgi:signal peptidase II